MHRVRTDEDDRETRFELLQFAPNHDPHFRVEIRVADVAAIRELYDQNKLIGVRMLGTPEGKKPQRSIIGAHEIHGLGLPEE